VDKQDKLIAEAADDIALGFYYLACHIVAPSQDRADAGRQSLAQGIAAMAKVMVQAIDAGGQG